MNKRIGLRILVSGAIVVAAALSARPAFAAASDEQDGPVASSLGGIAIPDPVGDTQDATTGTPLSVPPADIVRSGMTPGPDGTELTVQVKEPSDPITDRNWTSDSTYISWELDTTGDQQPDYVVEYFVHSGRITGQVHRASDADGSPPLCNLSAATFSSEAGYTAVVDPTCIGSPTTIAYRVRFFYDTKAGDDHSPVGMDVSPDTNLTPPISLPAPIPAAKAPQAAAAAAAPSPPRRAKPPPAPEATRAPSARAVTPLPPPSTSPSPGPGATNSGSSALARTGPGRAIRLELAYAGLFLTLAGLCFLLDGHRDQNLGLPPALLVPMLFCVLRSGPDRLSVER